MMKRMLSLLLVLCLSVGLLPVLASAAEEPALPQADVKKLGAYTYTGEYYSYDLVGNQKLTNCNGDLDMQIAMEFTATETKEQAATNHYANYTTDFFIEINGLTNGSAMGDGCYLAGYYANYKSWVKIPLDGFKIENGVIYPVITSAGFDFKYTDICGTVESFTCGIFFSKEFLAANPETEVTLSLGLSENKEKAVAGEFTTVEEYLYEMDARATIEVVDNEVIVTDNGLTGVKVHVFDVDGKEIADINNWSQLKKADPDFVSYDRSSFTLKNGEYVLRVQYNDLQGVMRAYSQEVTINVEGVELDVKDNKVSVNANGYTGVKVHVFDVDGKEIADINNWNQLKEADPDFATYTMKNGTYVLRAQYKDADGIVRAKSQEVTINYTRPIIIQDKTISVNVEGMTKVHVFYVEGHDVDDIVEDWYALKAAFSFRSYTKDVISVKNAGKYVLRVEYLDQNGDAQVLSQLVKVK